MATSPPLRSRSGSATAAAVARSPAPLLPDDDLHPHGAAQEEEAAEEHRRGPWTVDEDLTLVNYIADHGEGRWNSLARAAGLKRTGKSCRLRWLNYLRPNVKRGNFTADEQLLILDLHSRWGNRWSKIAQHLPGRTDNEIKNYWRTKVQKHAKQLNCDANSSKFKDAMRYVWMPRLLVDQQAAAGALLAADVHGYAAADAAHAVSSRQLASMGYVESSAAASMVSSSSESLATSESYDGGDLYANVHAGEMLVDAGDWMQQEVSHGLWPDQPITQDNNGGFQVDPELTGWVQGFSDGLPDNFWSLDSIWKTQ